MKHKIKCKNCEHFKSKSLKGLSLWRKIWSVSGFCEDSLNTDFNVFARLFGRGVSKTDKLKGCPVWCRFKSNNKNKGA